MSELNRQINPILSKSFFLFGARGVGKSSWIRAQFEKVPHLMFDLLNPELEDRLAKWPEQFSQEVTSKLGQFEWVIVDEVQKCPKLLNSVHQLISQHKLKFLLTGSSARRLRQKGVNLLAGRALTQFMFPFTSQELGAQFDLDRTLMYGALPEVVTECEIETRKAFLRSYALNYLKLEIQLEQWVRNLDPFRKFLQIAAQMNGKILNYSSIAREVGVEANTIQNYFEILEDTLVGYRLSAFHSSVRKQLRQAPKFYFFDLGLKRALERTLDVLLLPSTSAYGEAFEHFVFLEIFRQCQYHFPDWELSYLQTKDGAEIDLIVDRPGKTKLLIEIKSKENPSFEDTRHLEHFRNDFKGAELLLVSRQQEPRKIGNVMALPWRQFLKLYFQKTDL